MNICRLTVSEDISHARYELELYLLGGDFDLYEDERFISKVESRHSSAEVSFGKLILYCRGDGWSRSWRILRCEITPERFTLECKKQMGRTLCTVQLRRGEATAETAQSRSEFAHKLATMIEANFSGLSVERAVSKRNDRSHLSGVHARLTIKDRGHIIAGIGVNTHESQSNIDTTLGAGIIWFDALRRKQAAINRLMIFVPRGCATTIATRLTAVRVAGASISLYEVDETNATINAVAPFDQGDLSDRLRKASLRAAWPRARELPAEVAALAREVHGIAPNLIEINRRGNLLLLSIRGLEFAQISINRKQIEFGLGQSKERLTESNGSRLESLVSEIARNRASDCNDRNSPLFRDQAERWLESMLRRDVRALDASLDPRYVYSQVPAYRGEHRSFIDLLAATREGRLVVIELKVAEDSEFSFQGLDYWLRIEWHRVREDFERRGYFKDLKLTNNTPLLYLVAPLFRFHATTRLIASSIAERVPVYRVGINEDWRAGVRVLLTERLN
ncbi:MAG TPA: hypothetical protein VLR90_17280 [Blastocatellia bacterium]|nr:hypothetical protein [Blastocatellia bacterium]